MGLKNMSPQNLIVKISIEDFAFISKTSENHFHILIVSSENEFDQDVVFIVFIYLRFCRKGMNGTISKFCTKLIG